MAAGSTLTTGAAPTPELMFSFGLCQVVQGAKEEEEEGGWPKGSGEWLRAGPVPRAVTPARALAQREPLLGVVSAGLVLVQQDIP